MDSFNFIKEQKTTDKELDANILAWLLDPSESHNLKYKFLENFLSLINQKIDKSSRYKVIPNYKITYYENFINNINYDVNKKIDILIESEKTIYAIYIDSKNNDENSENNKISINWNKKETTIEDYKKCFEEKIKPNKDVIYIFLCIGNYNFKLDYVKYIKIEELLDIMPTSLDKKYQDFIDKYVEDIEEKCANKIINTDFQRKNLIKNWKNTRKSANIVRKLIQYFNLVIDYKVLNEDKRRYLTKVTDGIFIIFICENNCLNIQIRVDNDSKKYDSLIKKTKDMSLISKDLGKITVLQEIELLNTGDMKSDEIIETVKKSNIIKNYEIFIQL